MSPDPPPIQQLDGSVLIQGPETLALAYRATLAGIARRRAHGLPGGDLQELARALRRAHIDATSRPRHPLADSTPAGPCSSSQDRDWISAGEAASLLGVSRRQVQRLAADPRGGLGGVRVGRTWALKRSLVLALARRKEAAK